MASHITKHSTAYDKALTKTTGSTLHFIRVS